MLDLILNPTNVLIGLIALAVLTPLGALVVWRARPAARGRLAMALGAGGPIVLALYGLFHLLVAALGHDSIWTALVFFVVCGVLGIGLGGWIRGGAAPLREE